MIILLLFAIALSSPTSQSIVVCLNSCPDSTSGHLVEVSLTDDISPKIDQYLVGTKTDIYFYNESAFTFSINLDIFEGHTVEFQRLDDSKPVNVELECTNLNGKSTGTFTFTNIYVDLSSSLPLSQIEFDGLTLDRTTIDLFQVSNKLIVGSLTADNSIQVFSDISIKTSYSSATGVTLNIDSGSSIYISSSDNGAEVTLKRKKITFTYDSSLSSKRFDVTNTDLNNCKCEIEYQCSDVSKLIQFSITDMTNLYFLNSWPKSAIVNVINDDIPSLAISANSSVLPISLSGVTLSSIIITQESTTITGDISAPIVFVNPTDRFLIRKTILLSGSFSGSLLDLGSSYYDVTLSNLAIDISSYGKFPFAFRVGTGGASTLNVLKSMSTTTKMTSIYVYPDFQKYLPDENLQNLLTKNWTILKLADVSFSISYVNIILQKEPFIHGFIEDDSCISVRIESNTMILSASPPSLLPLNICYDGDKEGGECSDKDGIEIDDIKTITNYFEDGMKYLNLSIKAFNLVSLDLTSLDYGYEGVRIVLRGGSNTVIDRIDTKEGLGIDYLEINNIILGSTTFWIKEIVFNECKVDGHPIFTFKKCEHVTGDDSFIQNISPCISSSSKIPKISYRMDKYDAITITDTKYIFYDIDVNDLSDPADLDFDVVDFLDILYDIGMTETAKDNDLNITMETKNPPSFNVTFMPIFSQGIWDNPELVLYSWSQTKDSSFKCYFIHNDLNVKIVLTQPYQPAQLIPVGSGIVTYEDRYDTSVSLCTTLDSDKGICPKGSTYVAYDQLNQKLTELVEDNITIYIKSKSDNYPSIDIYNVNKKATYFVGLQETSSSPADVIEVTSSKDVDLTLTTSVFNNILVRTTSQTTKIIFGEVRLNNAAIDSSFKNVEVTIDDFFCEYKFLSCFKKVTITDNLIINGELATEESTVEFIPDNDANDLNATISEDVTLTMGDKSIKIGKTTFKFGSMEVVYDIVLYFESSAKNVQINKQSGVSEANIPNVQIRKTSGASFTFSGDWNGDAGRVQPHIFLFSEFNLAKINLAGPNTPLSFSSDGEVTLVSTAENVGITGYFDFHDLSSTINLQCQGVTKSTISIGQYMNIGDTINIKFMQPNIEFDLTSVNGNSRDRSRVQPVLFSSLEGDSLLVIKNQMNNAYISNDYHVQVPITEHITEQKVIDYYSKNHTLIKISTFDTGSTTVRSFQLIGTQPTTHGFTESNMNMKVDENTGDISLYFKKNPLTMPFTLCYEFDETTSSCEFVLTESNISNFADSLPEGAITIQARFGKENTNYFNLNIPKIKGSSVFIMQQTQAQLAVRMNLGNGIISLLSLDKVSGRIMDYSTYKTDRVEISNGAEIDQINGFGVINVDFDTVWKIEVFPPCNNEIILNLTAASLTFTEKGWLINSDSEIDSSSYPNLKFQLDYYITTKLEAAANLKQVKDTTIYSHTRKFVLGSNWQSVTSLSSKVNFIFEDEDKSDLSVTTSSYPFIPLTQLMSAKTIQFDPSVLPYKVQNSFTLFNTKTEIDFSNVADTPDKAHINFADITFEGLSSLSVKNSNKISDDIENNPITIDRLEVVDDSSASLSNALIDKYLGIYGDASLYGDFDVSTNLDIHFKWKLNKMPKLLIQTIPDKVPQLITLSFDEDSIDGKEKDYENYLYHHSFELIRINKATRCEYWKSVLVFDSPNVTLFGNQTIFDLSCSDTSLLLYGARHVKESNSSHKMSPGAIVGIIFAFVFIIGGSCFGIYLYLKKRNSSYQQLNTDVLDSKDLNQDQYTK